MFKLFAGHKVVRPDFYAHTVHQPFTNGAMEYGFVPKFANPLLLLTGTGYIPSQVWNVEQPPQVYASLAVPASWIGAVPGGSPQWQTELYNGTLQAGTDTPAQNDYTSTYDNS